MIFLEKPHYYDFKSLIFIGRYFQKLTNNISSFKKRLDLKGNRPHG
tara:strand:- start:2284 stop:2421 length:138 start_codon:yes stop_codon:yes gene_type:complete